MYILIAGAGTVGSYTADLLLRKGHEVGVIDSSRYTIERLNEALDLIGYHGDATDREIMRLAHVDRADLFIAATNIDEVNLTACAIAKRLGARKNLARVRDDRYYHDREEILDIFNLEMIFSPENLTAMEIANLIKTPGAFMVETFARGRAQMRTVHVQKYSPAQGRRLSELEFPKNSIVAAINRDGWYHIPSGGDSLFVNDILYLVGTPASLNETEALLSNSKAKRPRRSIFIYGDSAVAEKLGRILEGDRFDVKLLVSDPDRAMQFSERLDHSTVVHVESTNVNILREERIDRCDVFVGAGLDSDKNVIAVTLARNMGAKEIIVLVDNMDYYRVAEQLNIDHIISARMLTANSILKHIMFEGINSVTVLEEGKAEMFEMDVSANSQAVGKPIHRIGFPQASLIATIIRDNEVLIPRGSDKIHAGDVAIIFTHPGNIKKIGKIFSDE